MARFTLPRDLYHGKGSLEVLKQLKGERAMVCVGGGSMKRFGFLDRVITYLKEAGMEVELHETNIRGAHPNTVRLLVRGRSGRSLSMEAASVGGGLIEVTQLDGMSINFTGTENTLIIHHKDTPGMIAAVTTCLAAEKLNIATMQVYRMKAGEDAMMVLELDELPDENMMADIRALQDVESAIFLRKRGA